MTTSMELLSSGNVRMTDVDLAVMREKGYVVNMHTPYYVNSISVWAANGTEMGFHGWLDNLEFWLGNERIKIECAAHMQSCFAMMDAVLLFNSFRPE